MGGPDPLVTVSVPMWRAEATIGRCVESILGQTYGELRLVVVNDGGGPEAWAPLAHVDDPRLHRVDLPRNVGRYAVDHHVVASCSTRWWVPVDADDWVETGWLASLVDAACGAPSVVFAPQVVHPLHGGRPVVEGVRAWDGTDRLGWHAHLAGLWSVEFVRRHHLTNPAVRCAWDSLQTSAPWLLGRVAVADSPLYHRVRRHDSLTTSSATGMGSAYRAAVTDELRRLWAAMVAEPERTRELIVGATWPALHPAEV